MQDFESCCDAPDFATASRDGKKQWWTGFGCLMPDLSIQKDIFFAPFLNATIFRLMNWFYSGSPSKSIDELQSLIDNVILTPDFKISDFGDFNAKRELRRLDDDMETNSNNSCSTPFANKNGWKKSSDTAQFHTETYRFIETALCSSGKSLMALGFPKDT